MQAKKEGIAATEEALLVPELDDSASLDGNGAAAPVEGPVDWVATGLCFVFPAIGGLLFGYDIGATSGVLESLTSAQLSGTDWYGLSTFQSGLVVSMSLAGALAGSAATLAAGNRWGRRSELLTAALLYGISAALMGSAGSLAQLLCGRFTYGLGIGFAMHAAPAYISETAPPSARGLLISLKEVAIVGGILLGYLVSYHFAEDVGGWRSIYGIAAPLALALGVGMFTLPESARWLLLSGASRADARVALVKAEGSRANDGRLVDLELDAMAVSVAQTAGASTNPLVLVAQPRYYKPLLVGMSLMLFQQITGQPSVLYYAAKIFKDVGFSEGSDAAGVAVLLGVFKLLMTTVAVVKVDSWGRRPLLLGGVSGMVVALVALSIAQTAPLEGVAPNPLAAYASAGALLTYVGCYQVCGWLGGVLLWPHLVAAGGRDLPAGRAQPGHRAGGAGQLWQQLWGVPGPPLRPGLLWSPVHVPVLCCDWRGGRGGHLLLCARDQGQDAGAD